MRDDSAPASLEFERCGWRLHLTRRFVLLRPMRPPRKPFARIIWEIELRAAAGNQRKNTHTRWVREGERFLIHRSAQAAHTCEKDRALPLARAAGWISLARKVANARDKWWMNRRRCTTGCAWIIQIVFCTPRFNCHGVVSRESERSKMGQRQNSNLD